MAVEQHEGEEMMAIVMVNIAMLLCSTTWRPAWFFWSWFTKEVWLVKLVKKPCKETRAPSAHASELDRI